MICGVHGSPAYSVTDPTLSNRNPADIALTCAAGFFICAQPGIPASAAPTMNEIIKTFFIAKKSELLAGSFTKSIIGAPRRESDAVGDEQRGQAALILCRQKP